MHSPLVFTMFCIHIFVARTQLKIISPDSCTNGYILFIGGIKKNWHKNETPFQTFATLGNRNILTTALYTSLYSLPCLQYHQCGSPRHSLQHYINSLLNSHNLSYLLNVCGISFNEELVIFISFNPCLNVQ